MKRLLWGLVLVAGCGKSTGPTIATGAYTFSAQVFASAVTGAGTYSGTATVTRVTGDSLAVTFSVPGLTPAASVGVWNSDAYRMVVSVPAASSLVLRLAPSGGGIGCAASTYGVTGSGGLVNGSAVCSMAR